MMTIHLAVLIQCRSVMDKRADRQTDRLNFHIHDKHCIREWLLLCSLCLQLRNRPIFYRVQNVSDNITYCVWDFSTMILRCGPAADVRWTTRMDGSLSLYESRWSWAAVQGAVRSVSHSVDLVSILIDSQGWLAGSPDQGCSVLYDGRTDSCSSSNTLISSRQDARHLVWRHRQNQLA